MQVINVPRFIRVVPGTAPCLAYRSENPVNQHKKILKIKQGLVNLTQGD